eukprot:1159697-Pelagomonas_calceolata.AAC.3
MRHSNKQAATPQHDVPNKTSSHTSARGYPTNKLPLLSMRHPDRQAATPQHEATPKAATPHKI